MNWNEYTGLFETILNANKPEAPYKDANYLEYVKLNNSRSNRWNKRGELSENTINVLKDIKQQQNWILITEPWCGDSAHIAPFIAKMAEQSEKISFEIQLRDNAPHLIDNYLTNGGKAIPKLILRDNNNNDIAVWGPRPSKCQELVMKQKEEDLTTEEKKAQQQAWYNQDKGVEIQNEIVDCIKHLSH